MSTPKLFSWSRSLARGNPSGHLSPSRPSPSPGSLGCIFFPAKGRTQDPPARMALLVQQTLPPCTMRTRTGRRTHTDPSQSTTKSEVPQSAQGVGRGQQDPTCESHHTNGKAESSTWEFRWVWKVPDDAQHGHCPHGTELRFREELDVVWLRSASNLDLHQAAEAVAEQDEAKPTSPLPARKKELRTFILAGFRGHPHRLPCCLTQCSNLLSKGSDRPHRCHQPDFVPPKLSK